MTFKYKVETMMFNELKNNAVVPKFQRKLVWLMNEKKSFIDTLSKGYPFGAILIYKYENESKYSIIDGLQRYTTIEDYIQNPEKYIPLHEIGNSIITEFSVGESLAITTEQKYKVQIDKAIKAFIKESAKGNNTTQTFLKNIIEHIPEWSDKLNTMSNYIKLEQITKNLLEKVK